MWTILKIACGLVAAYAIWHALPANADPYPGSHASASTHDLVGPGPHLVIDGNHRVVGVITDEGAVVAVNPNLVKRDPAHGTVDNPNTIRLQTERIYTNPHIEWDCPRGMSVLRYGKRGC